MSLTRVEGAAAVARRPLFIKLAANTAAKNANTTLADTGLVLLAEALTVYEVKAYIAYTTATAADLKVQIVLPSGATLHVTPGALAASATGVSGSIQRQSSTTGLLTLGGTGAGTEAVAVIEGTITIGATPGAVKVQFAQSTSDASDSTVNAGSYLRLSPVA
jgi:hypothetical protein